MLGLFSQKISKWFIALFQHREKDHLRKKFIEIPLFFVKSPPANFEDNNHKIKSLIT